MKKRTKFLAVVVATVMAASTILTGCGEKENTRKTHDWCYSLRKR